MDVDVIIDDEPCNLLEREDRPRSHTWPILPPPSIETIPEDVCDGDDAQLPPLDDSNLTAEPKDVEKPDPSPRKNSRKNAWGNLSYADLITQAIQSSPEQRLTLSQIYDWMVRNIPYFKDKGDSTSSAGWKNSIRHNLSLHSRFMRVQNDNNGKSSYWVINPDAKPGKSSRRRSGSVDGAPKPDKAAKRSRSKKLAQSTDDITSLSPSTVRLNRQNHSCENLFNGASPCSSSDSISNMDDFVDAGVASYPFGDSFARPRSTSNVSTQSSINGGHLTPIQSDVDLDDDYIRIARLDNDAHMSADETANLVENMNLGRKVANVADTINLDDSLKMMKSDSHYASAGQFASEKLTRGHSDSFGSGDSGYESPAYFSPPQTQTTLPSAQLAGARLSPSQQMRSISSPVLNNISIKPPPPYYPPAASAGQLRSHAAMYGQRNHMQVPANFYGQQVGRNGQPLSQANCYGIGQLNPAVQAPPVPRLQHLPLGATMNMPNFGQNVCPPSHGMGSTTRNVQRQQQQNRSMASPYSGESYAPNVTIAPNQSMNNKGVVFNLTMNMCADSQTRSYYGQPQQTSYYGVTMDQDFPSDLDMLQLQGFADQQQLASDIDAIIKSDMGETCLDVTFEPVSSYSLPAHCVSAASSDLAGRPSAVSMGFMAVAGQGWVR